MHETPASAPDVTPGQSPELHSPPAPRQARFGRFRDWCADLFGLDLRTLALFRVLLASLTLADLWNRLPDIEAFYTDFGVLPRATFITEFANQNLLSFHLFGGTTFSVALLFVLHAIVATALLIGWRTRLMTILGWVFLMSLHGRNPYVLQGGDVLFRMLYFWAMFLPLGARWSVDAALAQTVTAQPNPAKPHRIAGIPTLAIILQTCFVYWFTMALKTGDEWWKDFTAVHYALHLDHFATPVAEWLRTFPTAMKALTISTAWIEILVPLMAILGGRFPFFRLLAVVMMVGLHAIFGSALKIGLFPYISSLSWIVMIPGWFWDKLEARIDRTRESLTFVVRSLASERWARLLKTGLLLRRVRIVEDADAEYDFRLMSESGPLTGAEALRAVLRSSPLTRWVSFLAPVLAPLAGVLHRSATRGWTGRRLARARQPIVNTRFHPALQLLVFGLLTYVFFWNVGTLQNPTKMSIGGTELSLHPVKMNKDLQTLGYTLRLDQTWNMFAPRPMKGDGWFVMPATLSDGRVIDLFQDGAEVAWEKPESVSSMYKSQRWRKYLMNLWMKNFKKHRRHYGRYMCRLWDRELKDLAAEQALPKGVTIKSFHLLYMKEETLASGP
ncbi:MAG: HTTM domain-containing protein, partial [Myxococcales bacterium]|nr:HTTM domain-containing protein [Myxococcales bacterium]